MIVITGATGNIGQHVVAELKKANADFRVMARNPDAARPKLGDVSIVQGDMDNPASMLKAFAGCDALFLLCVHGPTMEARQLRAVEAAKQAGIKRIVKVSGSPNTVEQHSPADTGREHWAIEQAIKQSGLEYAMLRPNFFMQNLLDLPAKMVSKGQTLKMPFPKDLPISFVDTRDIGACAARCLMAGQPLHDTYEITGAASSFAELAFVLSQILGRKVKFKAIPLGLLGIVLRLKGLDRWSIEHRKQIIRMFHQGSGSKASPDVEKITGHAPRNLKNFVNDTLAYWEGAEQI